MEIESRARNLRKLSKRNLLLILMLFAFNYLRYIAIIIYDNDNEMYNFELLLLLLLLLVSILLSFEPLCAATVSIACTNVCCNDSDNDAMILFAICQLFITNFSIAIKQVRIKKQYALLALACHY